jgi:ParB family chromosome partitioning protein
MASPEPQDALDRYELIPLHLIDEPANPERETMEELDLGELAISIQDVGLIQPLTVKSVGTRYEVTAGHRRLLACRIAPLSPVPCIIKGVGDIDPLAILVAENAFREDVNPIEEARFYQRALVDLCGNDVDVLCSKVRRNRNFVEDRLLLLRADQRVVDALQEKKISLAVARELNKTKLRNVTMLLLDTAIRQGATARQVREWVREYDGQEDLKVIPIDQNFDAGNGVAASTFSAPPCYFCGDNEDSHLMVMVLMHKPCKKIVDKTLGIATENAAQGAN